jgi:aspartokinase-like uncharacterized kinase
MRLRSGNGYDDADYYLALYCMDVSCTWEAEVGEKHPMREILEPRNGHKNQE